VDSGVAHHHEVNACPTDASIMEEGEEEERGGGDGWGKSDDDDDDDVIMSMTVMMTNLLLSSLPLSCFLLSLVDEVFTASVFVDDYD
jgi:hypothetical protein